MEHSNSRTFQGLSRTFKDLFCFQGLSRAWNFFLQIQGLSRTSQGPYKPYTNVSATCFHHLCRLRHIRWMLTAESAATLVHAFVTSCVDYCNVVLAGALKVITNKLLRVMNTAARVLTGTRKFDCGLTQLMHDNFHWLDVAERVKYKVIVLTRRCLIGTAPRYLAADCVPVSEMADVIYAPLLVISSSCRRTV